MDRDVGGDLLDDAMHADLVVGTGADPDGEEVFRNVRREGPALDGGDDGRRRGDAWRSGWDGAGRREHGKDEGGGEEQVESSSVDAGHPRSSSSAKRPGRQTPDAVLSSLSAVGPQHRFRSAESGRRWD